MSTIGVLAAGAAAQLCDEQTAAAALAAAVVNWRRVTVDGGTLSQNGTPLAWDRRGYYEVSLDAQSLSWAP